METLNCLIIDDNLDFCMILQRRLRLLGHNVEFKNTPKDGITFAENNKTFDVIFIDFRFENSKSQNGADVGMDIRKILPLSALVLMTAWGHEEIENYIYVGFDNFFSKYDEGNGANLEKMIETFESCVKKALSNAQKRCPSIFADDELTQMHEFLDAFEGAVQYISENKLSSYFYDYSICAAAELLLQGKPIDVKLLHDLQHAKKENQKILREANGLTTYNNYSSYHFNLWEPRGGYTRNSLIIRQLMMSNKEGWQKVRSIRTGKTPFYKPLYDLAKEFGLNF